MPQKPPKNTEASLYNPGEMLTVNRISAIRESILGLLSEKNELNLDLKDIKECDTAGIQILVSLKKYGRQQGKALSIINETEPVVNEALVLGFYPEDLFV